MKPVLLVAVAFAFSVVGCSENPVAPSDGLEPVQAVVLRHRSAASYETIPRFEANASLDNGIRIRVTTHAACGTIVSAMANRDARDGAIDVVSRVGGDPGANCAPIPFDLVADYQIVVPSPAIRIRNTTVRVNVFEERGGLAPEFLGTQTVVICCSL